MSGRLAGKVAIVTGGGRGIGRAIAERYGREGARVAIVDLDAAAAREAADAVGGEALAIQADVSANTDVERLLAETLERFGTVDVLVNNAAVIEHAVRHVLEADEAWWDLVVDVNLKGHFLCSLAAARHMARRRSGTIITMSSGGATRAHRGMAAYDASKGGIEALTRALALDLAPYGIRVAGLVPGFIERVGATSDEARAQAGATVPLGRMGVPEELAGPAVFLASDDAAYVTGSFVTVDGGVLSQQRSPQVETFPLERFPEPT
jgi:NAD(P)-dependent dehydrogenase (short-subunit alcohol dehydrogenase family)